MKNNRRNFLKKGALLGLAGVAGSLIGKEKLNEMENVAKTLADAEKFELPPLPYAFDALEPFIDKQTMEIHYTKHHAGYVNNLNKADLSKINFAVSDAEKCKSIDNSSPMVIRNNLGGHYNHSLFWQLLKPNPDKMENKHQSTIAEAINKHFKSFEEFKKEFGDKAMKVFGSGWCWLIMDGRGNLKITATPNQDNPLMQVVTEQGTPILALDVWEHAYYLKHQNKRADYVADWWSVVNWDKVQESFENR